MRTDVDLYDSDEEEEFFEVENDFYGFVPNEMFLMRRWQDPLTESDLVCFDLPSFSFDAFVEEEWLQLAKMSLTDFEQDSSYGRTLERKPRRLKRYRPYYGRSLCFSEDRESLRYSSDTDESNKVDKKKFIKMVVGRSMRKSLKKTKISPQFLSQLSGLDMLKMPKAKHNTRRIKYILEWVQESESGYMHFKHALQRTRQNRLLNYLQEVEFEIAISKDIDKFFVEPKIKRYRYFSRFYEDVEHMEKQLKMKDVLAELTVNTNGQDNYQTCTRLSVLQRNHGSDRFLESFKTDCFENEINRGRHQNVETQWKERKCTDGEKLNNLGRNTKSFLSLLFEAAFFGRGLSRSMKTLLVLALISCAAGENSNSFCSSSEWTATTWPFPNIEVFGRYESCYEWQKTQVGAYLPPELHIELQCSGVPIECISWQHRCTPFTICVVYPNRSFGYMNVEITFSYLDSMQTIDHQSEFFKPVADQSSGLNDKTSFQQNRCNEQCLRYQKFLKVLDRRISRNWYLTLFDEELVTRPCDHSNQTRVLEKLKQWKEVIKLSKESCVWLGCFSVTLKQNNAFHRTQQIGLGDKDTFLNVKKTSTGRVKQIRNFLKVKVTGTWNSQTVSGLKRENHWASIHRTQQIGNLEDKDTFLNVKKTSTGRVKQIRNFCRYLVSPLDRRKLKTMNYNQILEIISEKAQTSDEPSNILDMICRNAPTEIYSTRCSSNHSCTTYSSDFLFRLLRAVRAHEPIGGFWALTAVNRRVPVPIQIVCEKIIMRNWAKTTDYLLDNLYVLDTLLHYKYYEVIENYTSLINSLLSQEYCYNNRYYSITKTENNNNRNEVTPQPATFSEDGLVSYSSKSYPLESVVLVLIGTLCVFVRVIHVTKITFWFMYRKPPVSNPVVWILCILYSANTSDLIWLWGAPLVLLIETWHLKNKPGKKQKDEENQGVQEIGQVLHRCVFIEEDCVLSKTKENAHNDGLKAETPTISLENGNRDEFHSLRGKVTITKDDIEKEREFQKHLQLVEYVYGTEKEETASGEEITIGNDKMITIHEFCVQKGFNLSKTEEIIFEYFLLKENITTEPSQNSNPRTAFTDSEINFEDDSNKENDGQETTSPKYASHRRVNDDTKGQSSIPSHGDKMPKETELIASRDIQHSTLCKKNIETSEKRSTCFTDKGSKHTSDSAETNFIKGKLRLHVIPNPSTGAILKSDVNTDVSKMYGRSSLKEGNDDDILDLKSKSKNEKKRRKINLNDVLREAELAKATREYTWLSLNDLPVPKVDIIVAFVPQFEPLLTIIDQIANGTPPTPHVSMRYELLRFCTLRSYPKENKPYLIKLAEAGFYYASDGDGVVCYCCGVRRYNWVAEDNPMKIHERINPNCKFLRKNDEVNVPVQYYGPYNKDLMAIIDIPEPNERQEQSEDVNNDWAPERTRSPAPSQQNRQIETGANSLGINTAVPKHTQYATKTAREGSYSGWPDTASHTPQELAEAGFFYAGFGDCVRCFYCGIGLRHWTKDDNPWIEHARWSRNCVFVKQKKGEEFVNLVQLAVQYSQDNETQTNATAGNQLPAHEIERILLSDAAQSVLEMGYQPRIIKKAIEQSLRQNDSRKITAQILMEIVLEIEESENPSENVPVHIAAAAAAAPLVKPASDTVGEEDVNCAKPKTERKDNKIEKGKASAEDKHKPTENAKNNLESTVEAPDQDPKAIKAENEQLKEQTLCKVCLDNTVCIVFLPCGHLVTCADCAPAMRKCPICRALVKGTVRTYMS